MRGAALLSVCVALAIAAVVLVSGETTPDTGDATQSTDAVTQRAVAAAARNRTLNRLAAEDLLRNMGNYGNRNVRGTHVRCRAAKKETWLCSYVIDGKTCAAAVSGTRDDPETTLFCDSEGNKL